MSDRTQEIISRFDYYRNARVAMGSLIQSRFFMPGNALFFNTIMDPNQPLPEDAVCPLYNLFELGLLHPLGSFNLSDFDQAVLDCGLGIVLAENKFDYSCGDKPEAVSEDAWQLLCRFTHALSAYRICWVAERSYEEILSTELIKTGYQDIAEELSSIESSLPAIANIELHQRDAMTSQLRSCYRRVKSCSETLQSRSLAMTMIENQFDQSVGGAQVVLIGGLRIMADRLLQASTEFPDTTWMGDGWYGFFTNLLSMLIVNHYSYSYWVVGSISVNESFYDHLLSEIATFSSDIKELKVIDASRLQEQIEKISSELVRIAWSNAVILEEGQTLRGQLGLYGLFGVNLTDLAAKASASPGPSSSFANGK